MKDFSEARDRLKGLTAKKKDVPKPSDVAPPQEAPAGEKRAHPDQLFRDLEGPYPDFSPEGREPKIDEWLECGDMFVCFVDGSFVRDKLHIDYVEGGHYLRYAFIPENQIWIEDILSRIDQCSTVIHEAHEYFLMKNGMSYEDGHASASETERAFRNLVLEKGTILPDDDDMEKFVILELQGESCLELAREIMESADSSLHQWVRSTAGGE